ncbi:MAG: VWA domain-containing protein [Acidobacteria bacterium]|nr:VWA domain-containing protein [Acidobacteriota bacterium]
MRSLLGDFIAELRAAGLPVSMTEHVDAARALTAIDIGDRAMVKASLAATLVKNSDHLPVFSTAFDVYFAHRSMSSADLSETDDATDDTSELSGDDPSAPGQRGRGQSRGRGGGGGTTMSAEELAEMLLSALMQNNATMMRQGAREAVERYAGMEPGRPVGGTYYLYRTLRNLDLEGMIEKLIDLGRADGQSDDALGERLARDEARARVEALKAEIEAEIRERLVDDRGAQALGKSVRKPLPEDIDVMHANRDEMAQLERALRPLSRKLATRLARRRRRRRRGPVDLRHTVRRSLSTGGVPLDLRFKPPHPAKPEIVVIADISGSVASFARFTLHLVHAISSQFTKVRSFVFVDGLDEVTHLFEESDDPAEAVARINAEADVIAFDGHSDYGRALMSFHERFADTLTKRSVVLILGDARNNYHQAYPEILADIRFRSRSVFWLNPEPTNYWNSGDSVIREYAPHCDRVVECRSLRQLEEFVGELA